MNAVCQMAALACLAVASTASAHPAVAGTRTTIYSTVPVAYRPYTASWDAQGRLYLGSDNNATSGEFLRRVPAGGGPSEVFADSRIFDPDGILVDVNGTITGVAGSVLAASGTSSGGGQLSRIDPDGSVSLFLSQGSELNNCDAMVVDANGTIYINVPGNRTIARRTAGTFSTCITLGATDGGVLAIDDNNKLWVGCGDGAVRRYALSGATPVLDLVVPIGSSAAGLGYCGGGVFPKGVYAVNRSSKLLYRIADDGSTTIVGTDFPSGAYSLAFNEHGDLIVPDWDTGTIWLFSCGADYNTDGFFTFEDFDAFVQDFEAGNEDADFNNDGFLTFEDFDAFVALFESGC
ncbi:MAG: GC-type dockerin domain-anchored protein [Planctomycetota bacterium]|nr:GC-type dockerin domain-anchored protein [Planctomycetota bacterium]